MASGGQEVNAERLKFPFISFRTSASWRVTTSQERCQCFDTRSSSSSRRACGSEEAMLRFHVALQGSSKLPSAALKADLCRDCRVKQLGDGRVDRDPWTQAISLLRLDYIQVDTDLWLCYTTQKCQLASRICSSRHKKHVGHIADRHYLWAMHACWGHNLVLAVTSRDLPATLDSGQKVKVIPAAEEKPHGLSGLQQHIRAREGGAAASDQPRSR